MIRATDSEAPASGSEPTELAAHLECVFHKQRRRYRKALRRCRRKFSEESVHQLRVETRRMLTLLGLLHTLWWDAGLEKLQRRLKRLFKSFSRLRDTQVQLLFVRERQERFPEIARFHRALTKREGRLTACVSQRVEQFEMRKVRKLAAAAEKTLKEQRKDCNHHRNDWPRLLRSVEKTFAHVAELGSHIDPARPATIHRVRVAFKKFRYLVEVLQPLLPGVTDHQIEAMHDYQTLMGEIQDAEVLEGAVEEFIAKKRSRARKLLHFREYLKARRAVLVAAYMREAGDLAEFWPPHAPGALARA